MPMQQEMRPARQPAFALASLLALVLAGCGGGSSAPSANTAGVQASTPPPAAGTASAVQSNLSPHAQFAAFARAVNLQSTDLPGFRVQARTGKRHSSESEGELTRCAGIGEEPTPLLKEKSAKFVAGAGLSRQEISSQVEVESSVARVRHELAEAERAIASPRVRACMERSMTHLAGTGRPKAVHTASGTATMTIRIGSVDLTPIALASLVPQTHGAFGLTMRFDVSYVLSRDGLTRAVPVTFVCDVLAFAVGRAAVTLSGYSTAGPLPPQQESTLFSQLASRAVAAARRYPEIGARTHGSTA